MDRSNKKYTKILNYINAKQQIPVPCASMLHIPLTNVLHQATKQGPYKKAYLNEKY